MKQAEPLPHEARPAPSTTVRIRAVPLVIACLSAALPASAQVGSPAGPVPVDLLQQRRAALLDAIGDGVGIVRAADPREIETDYPQDSDYREQNDFFYLTGIEAPGSYLVLIASGESQDAVLYMPPRDPREEQWTGPKLGPGEEAAALTGLASVRSMERIRPELDRLLENAADVWVPMTDGSVCGGRSLCSPALDGLGITVDDPEAVAPLIASLRLVKDADELRRLRQAIDITANAQREAMAALRPGMREYEIEAVIEYTFRRNGAERVGFPSIVGSGPNSVTLHYDKNRREMEAGELVVMDIGAEWGYYTADITRTAPVSGRFTARQRAVYELVLSAQQAAIDAVKPGVTVAQLNSVARRHIDEHSADLCGGDSCNRYFVHGLSHWLGMDVHDVGDYERPLEAGMVLTIEPGIYIASENLGVRIEDDILVTATGHEVLSTGAPRTADEVERAMAAGRTENDAIRREADTAGYHDERNDHVLR
jgi:Xaa-Pro aminopeptidase